jgi:hypothetical protein
MSIEAARKLVEVLDINTTERLFGKPFLRQDYKTFPIDAKNFKRIKTIKEKGRIAFVDGGNQEILHAPNFSVQINRVYYNIFNGTARENPKGLPSRIEFFSATYSDFHNDKLFFKTLIFPLRDEYYPYMPNEKDLCFDSSDRTMMIGMQRADISRVASVARRFAEWEFASHVVKEELEEENMLVVDGTLQAPYTNEPKYVEKIQKQALHKKVHFVGLSKTCELHTTTGLSLVGAIRKLAVDNGVSGIWYYPIASISSPDHKATLLMVKLQPNAERIFRFEIFSKDPDINGEIPERALEWLSYNSSDISFPGYPYGLIDADMFARVREDEVEGYQLLLLSEISKQGKWEKFARHIQASDAHDVLNMLMR